MFNSEFLITTLIVVLIPGTGVIYTMSIGLFIGKKESLFAAIGCTLGIVPHLIAAIFGLSAILHTSAVAFTTLKIIGVIYLLYLAYCMWKENGMIKIENNQKSNTPIKIAIRAFLMNILNPKLSIFFLAFLPQFISPTSITPINDMVILSLIFMALTFIVFTIYGIFAHKAKTFINNSPKIMLRIQRVFASIFVIFSAKLAMAQR